MSLHVKDDFAPGTPISAVGCDWFNKVGGFVNALIGGFGLKVSKPSRPSVSAPVSIEIDPDAIRQALAVDETEFDEMETPSVDDVPENHRGDALIDTEWARGGKKGVKLYLPTDSWDDGAECSLAWRLCEFDRYGCLQRICGQTIRTASVSNDQL
ncbi:MAG: hypothetical protein J6S05_01075 [Bacteroidaceae bacterium]|nr:hypothetical protein [Bacteroidaceae bacterium]